jgi:monoamine oxidase
MRAQGAPPAVVRVTEIGALGLAGGSGERTSLLAALRMDAAAGALGAYDLQAWESTTVAQGSAAVPLRMAEELGPRLRLGAAVRSIAIGPRVRVGLEGGEMLTAEAVVCAVPAGPLRDVAIDGLSAARLRSLHRQRHALAAKAVAAYPSAFWRDRGQNGLAEGEGLIGSVWPQADGVLSLLVPPERLAHHLAAPADVRREQLVAGLIRLFGDAAGSPTGFASVEWGVERFTQGYVAQWAPGDVLAVGPLHGTHEPPFYVAGSDHWVAGFMEGAVRTGRAAAAAALGERAAAGPA